MGVCASAIDIDVKDGIIKKVTFMGGCRGNTQGVAKLCENRRVEEVIPLLKGIPCRGATSCPDQLALALENYIQNN